MLWYKAKCLKMSFCILTIIRDEDYIWAVSEHLSPCAFKIWF